MLQRTLAPSLTLVGYQVPHLPVCLHQSNYSGFTLLWQLKGAPWATHRDIQDLLVGFFEIVLLIHNKLLLGAQSNVSYSTTLRVF